MSDYTLRVGTPAEFLGEYGLRFYGNGVNDIDRVKIRIGDNTSQPGPPINVGDADFTIEFFMNAELADNPSSALGTWEGTDNWILGNIIIDRDRLNTPRSYGISIAGGRVAFGAWQSGSNFSTAYGTTVVADGEWHHIACTRDFSTGELSIFIDGLFETSVIGPAGDISYPANGNDGSNDEFIVIGAEKHDIGPTYPPFNGTLDEMRWSNTIRYTGASYTVPEAEFVTDANTVGLYHFSEGIGTTVADSSGVSASYWGDQAAVLSVGGSPQGPEWVTTDPFVVPQPPSGALLTSSNWDTQGATSGAISDGGLWNLSQSAWNLNRMRVVAGATDCPTPNMLEQFYNAGDGAELWTDMFIDAPGTMGIGDWWTWRWYFRFMDDNVTDDLNHGFAWRSSGLNNDPMWQNVVQNPFGLPGGADNYYLDYQLSDRNEERFSHADTYGPLSRTVWYRFELSARQITSTTCEFRINVYDAATETLLIPSSQWQTTYGYGVGDGVLLNNWVETSRDIRNDFPRFIGFNSGANTQGSAGIWGQFAAVACVAGESVGAYNAIRGW